MPSTKASSTAGTTPLRTFDDPIPDSTKERVDNAPGNITGQRCLVENIGSEFLTDYAYVLPRATNSNDKIMCSLEHSWNMKQRTLHIDTHRNVMILTAKMHRLFDHNKWLLLPDYKIIERYDKAGYRPLKFPKLKEKSYRYTFVAHPDMRPVALHRMGETQVHRRVEAPGVFRKYTYPFSDFPVIVSHVHPTFVICNVGQKLTRVSDFKDFAGGDEDLLETLIAAARVYRQWTEDINYSTQGDAGPSSEGQASRAKRHPPSNPAYGESSDSDDSSHTFYRKKPSPSPSDILLTISERVPVGYSLTRKEKTRVDKISTERCIIENTTKDSTLDYAHVLPRSSKDALLTSLEFAWKMPRYTLNVNTSRNIFRLSANFHRLFNHRTWLLIPETSIVEQYYNAKDNPADFPEINSPQYTYTLIADRAMGRIPIHRLRDKDQTEGNDVAVESPNAFANHRYPYPQFPSISSHVHPCFIIYNAGAKLHVPDIGISFMMAMPHHKPTLNKILDIYEAWTGTGTRAYQPFVAGKLGPSDTLLDDDLPDDKTDLRRPPPPKEKQHRHSSDEEDGPAKKRAKSGGGKDSAWLDDDTYSR